MPLPEIYAKDQADVVFLAFPDQIIATEIYSGYFYRFWSDHELFSEIASGDVVVFHEVEATIDQRTPVCHSWSYAWTGLGQHWVAYCVITDLLGHSNGFAS